MGVVPEKEVGGRHLAPQIEGFGVASGSYVFPKGHALVGHHVGRPPYPAGAARLEGKWGEWVSTGQDVAADAD